MADWMRSAAGQSAMREKKRLISELEGTIRDARRMGNTSEVKELERELAKLKSKDLRDPQFKASITTSVDGFLSRGGTGAVPPKLGDKFDANTLKGYADSGLAQFLKDVNAELAKRGLKLQSTSGAGIVQSPRGGAKIGKSGGYVVVQASISASSSDPMPKIEAMVVAADRAGYDIGISRDKSGKATALHLKRIQTARDNRGVEQVVGAGGNIKQAIASVLRAGGGADKFDVVTPPTGESAAIIKPKAPLGASNAELGERHHQHRMTTVATIGR